LVASGTFALAALTLPIAPALAGCNSGSSNNTHVLHGPDCPGSATGAFSTAVGAFAASPGNYSAAVGDTSTATGVGATALGYASNAAADGATAIGGDAAAQAVAATAVGVEAFAKGSRAPVVGHESGPRVAVIGATESVPEPALTAPDCFQRRSAPAGS
jgi:hypothetical protein